MGPAWGLGSGPAHAGPGAWLGPLLISSWLEPDPGPGRGQGLGPGPGQGPVHGSGRVSHKLGPWSLEAAAAADRGWLAEVGSQLEDQTC